MFENFFMHGSIPSTAESGHYNFLLVLLSYVVATFASYIALSFARHLTSTEQQAFSKRAIHFFGAFSLGAGIWSMHFIGMLAYEMKMTVHYNLFPTFFSMMIAIFVAYFVLKIVNSASLTFANLFLGAISLGAGISLMHYSGMTAMVMDADLRYLPVPFFISIAIAVTASAAALLIAFKFARLQGILRKDLQISAAMLMGLAICGMHYTGMESALFLPYANCRYGNNNIDVGIALTVGVMSLAILAGALFFSTELNKDTSRHSHLSQWVHNFFYRQALWFVIFLGILGGLIVVWQLDFTESQLNNVIRTNVNAIQGFKLQQAVDEHLSDLSIVLAALTIASTTVILFFVQIARKSEAKTLKTKETLENQLKEKERMEGQLNAYVERMEAAQFEMFEARMLAEKASQAKSDFLANMSHEIRTPMNGVLGMAGLLLDTQLNSEQRGWAEIIKKSGENLLDIINDILDFSKIEAGKLELEPVPFNLHDAIEEVTDVLRLRTQEKGIELLAQFDQNTPKFVLGDPGRIRQILINLLGNAIKFTEKGHVLIAIKGQVNGGNARLFFEIQDTGIGIPQSKLDYIFQKFSQAEESTTRKFGGTGLGLTISKSLVEMMGGNISVSSKTGEGSSFSFDITLPLTRPDEIRSKLPEIDLNGVRALIVDDYQINCEILYQYLRSWGMECDAFTSGKDAFDAAIVAHRQGKPYDIALVDYVMDDMNGLELAEKIRRQPELNSNMLVMVTSATQVSTPEDLKNRGLAGFLSKPYYPEQLKALIQIVLDARKHDKDIGLVTRHMISRMLQAHSTKQSAELKQYPSKRILVVEDVTVNLMLVAKLLEKHGIRVDSATNGAEAVEMLERFTYDLVLMDCQMPIMDGFEATKTIRNRELEKGKSHTPIVALTADAMTGDREKCLSVGMDDYLNKPLKFQEVSHMLERWLGDYQQSKML